MQRLKKAQSGSCNLCQDAAWLILVFKSSCFICLYIITAFVSQVAGPSDSRLLSS